MICLQPVFRQDCLNRSLTSAHRQSSLLRLAIFFSTTLAPAQTAPVPSCGRPCRSACRSQAPAASPLPALSGIFSRTRTRSGQRPGRYARTACRYAPSRRPGQTPLRAEPHAGFVLSDDLLVGREPGLLELQAQDGRHCADAPVCRVLHFLAQAIQVCDEIGVSAVRIRFCLHGCCPFLKFYRAVRSGQTVL